MLHFLLAVLHWRSCLSIRRCIAVQRETTPLVVRGKATMKLDIRLWGHTHTCTTYNTSTWTDSSVFAVFSARTVYKHSTYLLLWKQRGGQPGFPPWKRNLGFSERPTSRYRKQLTDLLAKHSCIPVFLDEELSWAGFGALAPFFDLGLQEGVALHWASQMQACPWKLWVGSHTKSQRNHKAWHPQDDRGDNACLLQDVVQKHNFFSDPRQQLCICKCFIWS